MKIFYSIIIILGLTSFNSWGQCSTGFLDNSSLINISPSGGSISKNIVFYNCNGSAFTFSAVPSWLTISSNANGSIITASASLNTSTPRFAEITCTIPSSSISFTIMVFQGSVVPNPCSISFPPIYAPYSGQVDFSISGGQKDVTPTFGGSACGGILSISNVPSWLSVNVNYGPTISYNISVSPNNGLAKRNATIIMSLPSQNIYEPVQIIQEGTGCLWYTDSDGDGWGDQVLPVLTTCSPPFTGAVANNYDNCPSVYGLDFGGCSTNSNFNWVSSLSQDIKGNTIGQTLNYFDDLGKATVSLSKDFVQNRIWGTETIYDDFGRPDKTSFIAPSPSNSFDKVNFFKTPAQILASAIPVNQNVGTITTSQTIQVSNTLTANGLISGLNVTFIAGSSIILGNGFKVSASADSSFKAVIAVAPNASANDKLANYYSDSNTLEPYQATATQPFSQNNYDSLNPGNVINVVGGNKINGEWKTGYSYTVPAAQEMYYVYGSDYYEGAIVAGKEEVITKFYKSVSVDANGVENVAFSDGEGKVLASARSGGASSYPVVSLIGTQGFVDVHIPAGISSAQITLIDGDLLYNVYDLKTGLITTSLTGGNAYRIEAKTPPTTDPKTYITITGGVPTYDAGALGIVYSVNYYDYSLNVYNKTGQLLKSVQPNGYVANASIVAVPTYMASGATAFISTYTYNALGQVIQASSPDEGTSKFAYRQDGQIRYSQSALQSDTKVSYTDYDTYGRPIESGVITIATGIWATANTNADTVALIGTLAQRSEQTFTVYDDTANTLTSVPLPTTPTNLTLTGVLTTAGIPTANYTQNNLSGNVAVTYTKPGATITAITWYSYDIYGRSEWMVQYNEDLGAKTIHYEYDYKGNVKKVLYQKDKVTELFVHKYIYDRNDVLKKVQTSINTTTFNTQAYYSYYLTGELKRVSLIDQVEDLDIISGEGVTQGMQGIDYVYTLGGALKSINHPSLEATKDPGGDANDVFGITLDYYPGDYLRSGRNITASPTAGADYNGNIKASRWTNKGISEDMTGTVANTKGYLYNYDRNNWLTAATFGTADASTATISPATKHKEGNLTYDANGNIRTLQRTDASGTVQDNLTYNYTNTGNNQLNNVTDAIAATVATTDIDSQASGNYTYDAIGQMTANIQENLTYYYNTQGLVTQVNKGANLVVKFFYNERGQRIKKESYATTGSFGLISTDYYALDLSGNTMAIYNKIGTAAIVQKDLPIFGLSRLGVYNRASAISSYEITDHLGNVRAVIQKVTGTPQIKSFADYYPFGEQLLGRNSNSGNYRYAFQGQELDTELGMEAFQLRLWDGRIGRWLSPDPMGQYASPYLGMGNNPVNMIDSDGGIAFNAAAALIGAAISGGISAYTQYQQTGKIDIARVVTASAFGALAGFTLNPAGIAAAGSLGDVADQYIEHRGDVSKINITKSLAAGGAAIGTFGLTKVITSKTTIGLVYRVLDKVTEKTGIYYGRVVTGSVFSPSQLSKNSISIVNYFDKGVSIGTGYFAASKTFSDGFSNDYVKDWAKNQYNRFNSMSQQMMNQMMNRSNTFRKGSYLITIEPGTYNFLAE
jgi:RHS repeat-associated protein